MLLQLLAMTIKDLKILLKNRGSLVALFVIPAMLIIVMANVPGWALFGVFFISGILAQHILEDKRTGAFRRLLAAPVSRATVLLGRLVSYVIVNLIQIAMLFLVGYLVLPLTGLPRLEWGTHPEGLIVISVCASLTASALGLRNFKWD